MRVEGLNKRRIPAHLEVVSISCLTLTLDQVLTTEIQLAQTSMPIAVGVNFNLIPISHVFYVAGQDDEEVTTLLRQYHSEGITSKKVIAKLLSKKGHDMR